MNSVFALHPNVSDVQSLLRYLNLDESVDLKWDEKKPDILIASEHIYTSRAYFEKFRSLYYRASIRLMLAFEAEKPDWNLFDYAVGFDNKYQDPERFVRLLSPLDMFHKFVSKRKNDITTIESAKSELNRKKLFCNFLYSNPNAHPMRDKLFYGISKYKRVDSLGKHLNNVEKEGTGFINHAGECISIKSPYKFSIASENAVYNGYTSEKIFTSLEAHTIPIYFGNPDIAEDVNPACFINASDFDSIDSLVSYIKEIDENDSLWCQYVSTPWFTKEQEKNHENRTIEYRRMLLEILAGNAEGNKKLFIGTRQSIYRDSFLKNMFSTEIPNKISRKRMFCNMFKNLLKM